jgi:hypothetical protein
VSIRDRAEWILVQRSGDTIIDGDKGRDAIRVCIDWKECSSKEGMTDHYNLLLLRIDLLLITLLISPRPHKKTMQRTADREAAILNTVFSILKSFIIPMAHVPEMILKIHASVSSQLSNEGK